MPDTMRVASMLLAGALGVVGLRVQAVQTPALPTSQLTGSARISGHLLADDDGKPVRRAEVSISGRSDADPHHLPVVRTYETDGNGRFEFTDLPAGTYAVTLNQLTGFVAPAGYQLTKLTERQSVELNIRLARTGAIEGRILDQYGDPLLRATVMAIKQVGVGGYIALGDRSASTQTDDRGEFRIFNLSAGDYYLVAARPAGDHPHDPAPPAVGYVTTYFPGSTQRSEARAVTVRAGRDVRTEPFRLSRRALATLSIEGVDSSGNPLGTEASANLRRLDSFEHNWSYRAGRRVDRGFTFEGVEPGDYSVVIRSRSGAAEAAYRTVSIDQKDVTLKVKTTIGARVAGRVFVDGLPAKGGPGLPNVWVSAHTPGRTFGVSYTLEPNQLLQSTDRFELTGLRGPVELSASMTYGNLVSIRRGAEELAWKVIDFAGTEVLDDLVVELTSKVARVELTVPTPDTQGGDLVVFIFPDDRQRWRAGLAIQTDAPAREIAGGSGRVATANLLPGRYLIVALNAAAVLDPADTALLAELEPLATAVDLPVGMTKVTVPLLRVKR